MKKLLLLWALLQAVVAQSQLSIGTDLSLARQMRTEENFWSPVQTIRISYPFSNKISAYASLGYANGHETRHPAATTAFYDSVSPRTIRYTAITTWRTRHGSLGLKYYILGSHAAEAGSNIYLLAGVGGMSVKTSTKYSVSVDTSNYMPIIPYQGEGAETTWSYEAGAGYERPLGGNFFWYLEAKTWQPQGTIKSPYLLGEDKSRVLMFGAGLRILFGYYN